MVVPDTISKIFLPNLSTITTANPVAITFGTKYERHNYTVSMEKNLKIKSVIQFSIHAFIILRYLHTIDHKVTCSWIHVGTCSRKNISHIKQDLIYSTKLLEKH